MAMIINEEFIDSGQILDGELLYQLFIAIKDMLEEKRWQFEIVVLILNYEQRGINVCVLFTTTRYSSYREW